MKLSILNLFVHNSLPHIPILNHIYPKVFPYFFLSCKANAKALLARTGGDPHSFQFGDNFYAVTSPLIVVWPLWARIPENRPTKVVNCVVLCFMCKCILYYCHRVSTQLQLTNIPYHISYHTTYHIILHISHTISTPSPILFLRDIGLLLYYGPRVLAPSVFTTHFSPPNMPHAPPISRYLILFE
jgi:hypothetical protein